jgi:hypothetical protein
MSYEKPLSNPNTLSMGVPEGENNGLKILLK